MGNSGVGNPDSGERSARRSGRERSADFSRQYSPLRILARVSGVAVLFFGLFAAMGGLYISFQPSTVAEAGASEPLSEEQLEGVGRAEGSGALEGGIGAEPGVSIGGGSGASGEAKESGDGGFVADGPPPEKGMRLTVPEMERVDDTPVIDGSNAGQEAALRSGTLHPEGTGFPWEEGSNTFIAGHRLGYPGTGSNLVFYDLDELEAGDKVMLRDSAGRSYEYRVYEKLVVEPDETRVMAPVKGKDIVTLQTCTLPSYSERLIVRAERV